MTKIKTLLSRYSDLQSKLPVIESSVKYGELVTANGAADQPVQRWFRMKEAFSVVLLETLLDDWHVSLKDVHRVLDPFCGAGTTLLAVQRLAKLSKRDDLEAIGFERNPFLRFVSIAKSRWHAYDEQVLAEAVASLMTNGHRPERVEVPELSTLHRRDVIDSRVVKSLLGFREGIETWPSTVRNALLMGYANSIEKVTGIRKDGRALRIVAGKKRASVKQALLDSWTIIQKDLQTASLTYEPVKSQVYKGDGRTLRQDCSPQTKHRGFDVVVYSPPYLNNIDYTEVYKLELWLCGFVNSCDSFRSLRHETFRSHPSVKFSDQNSMSRKRSLMRVADTVNSIVEALPDDNNKEWRTGLIQGYFDDLYISLKHQKSAIKKGGWVFCVIGNSLHGPAQDPESRVPIASDIITAQIASTIGFQVRAIQVARHLTRRYPGNGYLRESIIVLQKE
jgi:hypothetical protein